jgi:PPOX class probable F420-dependent enzyme
MPLDKNLVRLAKAPNFATTVTLLPDGQPQAQLRWVDVDGDELVVNTEPQRQAARDVERDPRITVLIRAEDDPYDWAEARGEVVKVVEGDEARTHIDALSRKYTGADYQMPIGPKGRVILRIAPHRVVTSAQR